MNLCLMSKSKLNNQKLSRRRNERKSKQPATESTEGVIKGSDDGDKETNGNWELSNRFKVKLIN